MHLPFVTATANAALSTQLDAAIDSKTYSGDTASKGVVGRTGLVGGDTVSGLSQAFTSKNVMGTNASSLKRLTS